MNKSLKITIICAAALAVFWLYVSVMHPSYKNDDSPETVAASVTMGIGHPPGYPLFSIAGKAASLMPFGSYSFRVNLLSVLLGLLCLAVAFKLIRIITPVSEGRGHYAAAALGAAVLALNYVFWNQALEAKGGIYMMNLLLTLLLLYGCFRASDGGGRKYIYFVFFVFGLGLSNHWPSMIILAPLPLWAVFQARGKLSPGTVAAAAGFAVLGLTAYLYLPIRAIAGPALNWGEPKTLKDFLWVVLRKAYVYPVEATAELYIFQIKHFFKSLGAAYLAAGIFALIGIWQIFLRRRKYFVYCAALFLLVSCAVILYNRTKEELSWIIDIFLLPAFFTLGLAIPAGITFAASKAGKFKPAAYAAAAACALFLLAVNYPKNDASRDYLAYDFGKSILATMEENAVYIADGDYNLMPVYYEQEINKNRRDVKFATVSFLIFDWGIREFQSRAGDIPMKPMETNRNIENIISAFSPKVSVYRSAYFPRISEVNHGLKESQKGLLIRMEASERVYPASVFGLYSYRNVFDRRLGYSRNDMDLVGWFPVSMVNQANSMLSSGMYEDAAKLNKKALLFPNKMPVGNIQYNISLSYRGLNDLENEIKHLNEAVKADSSIYYVYERLGVLYYDMGMLGEAKPLLIKAAAKGQISEQIKNAILVIDGMNRQEMLEIALIKANENISKNDLIRAKIGYEYLLENKYKTSIINMNLGVFHFKTGDLALAEEYFKRSKNETPMPNSYLYLAFVLHSLGRFDDAIKEAEEGIQRFPEDKGIADFLRQLKETNSEEKNRNSTDRQR